jgi:hypothetical protein
MKICSREYDLTFDKKQKGASFWCNGRRSGGRGEICIGKYKDLRTRAEMLVHEVLEAIFVEDGKRSHPTSYEQDNGRYTFHFDHDYFDGVGPKVTDALLSSGMFRLKEIGKKEKHHAK